jgi:predicted RNA-binding protein with PUA-like domain
MPAKKATKKAPSKSTKKSTPVPMVSTGFWLLKSEPESYSIDQFAKDKKTLWTGVRNYLARNFMMEAMKPGDKFLFYHSNAEPSGVAGVGEIVRPNQPDPTALDSKSDYFDPKSSSDHPIWFCCEVKFVSKLKRILPLGELKDIPALKNMALLQKGQRLSVQQVTKQEFETVLKLAEA